MIPFLTTTQNIHELLKTTLLITAYLSWLRNKDLESNLAQILHTVFHNDISILLEIIDELDILIDKHLPNQSDITEFKAFLNIIVHNNEDNNEDENITIYI